MHPLLASLLLALPTAHAGYVVDDGLAARIAPQALEGLAVLMPEELPVEEVATAFDLWVCEVDVTVSGLELQLEVLDLQVEPGNDELDLSATLLLSSNTASMTAVGCLLDEDCALRIPQSEVALATTLAFAFDEASATVTVTVGELELSFADDLEGVLDGCNVGAIIEFFESLGLDVYEWLVGLMADSVREELEVALNDALTALTLEQELELGEGSILLQLWPSQFGIDGDGVRLWMSAELTPLTTSTVCDPSAGFLSTPGGVPALDAVAGVDLALGVDDDLANAALVAACEAGVTELELTQGIDGELTTYYLSLLSQDEGWQQEIEWLWPQESPDESVSRHKPMMLRIRPQTPLAASFGGEPPVTVSVEAMPVELWAVLDHRWARLLTLILDGEVGLDLSLEDAWLLVTLSLDGDALALAVADNEIMPAMDPVIEESLPGLLESYGDGAALYDDALPRFQGLTIGAAEVVAPEGSGQDWLGVYGDLHLDTGPDTGGDTGHGSSDCSGGGAECGSLPVTLAWLLVLPLLAVRRR